MLPYLPVATSGIYFTFILNDSGNILLYVTTHYRGVRPIGTEIKKYIGFGHLR